MSSRTRRPSTWWPATGRNLPIASLTADELVVYEIPKHGAAEFRGAVLSFARSTRSVPRIKVRSWQASFT